MSRNMLGRLLAASAALGLAACGGGGSSYVAPMPPPPPPSPSPSPSPPPTTTPAIFPNITTDTTFAVLGLQVPPTSSPLKDGFSVKFDAASNSYVIGIPNQAPGGFVSSSAPTSEDSSFWYGGIRGDSWDRVSIFKPSASNPKFQLAYTSFGVAGGYYSAPVSIFAFGSATPALGIPPSGNATYDAYVVGNTGSGPTFTSPNISGSATLLFDFGGGTLSGHFDPILTQYIGTGNTPSTTNLGTYTFVNSVYGAGKTNFSGQLSITGTNTLGAFDGQFTGPAAQELMARWTAPYLPPGIQTWDQMFGVWVGKKH